MADTLMRPRSIGEQAVFAHSRQSAIMAGTRPTTRCASSGSGQLAALGVAGWLSLAAAPTFAIMALIAGVSAIGQPDVICSAMHEMSPLTGMVSMYALMSVFHLRPWLKLASRRRNRVSPS